MDLDFLAFILQIPIFVLLEFGIIEADFPSILVLLGLGTAGVGSFLLGHMTRAVVFLASAAVVLAAILVCLFRWC